MGCINSTKKLSELKNDNVLRVRAVCLQPESRIGSLELNSRELIFIIQGRHQEEIVWALQHLRRYGLNGDIFSFEAGRRCMTGPGIYMFRCRQAERLYHLFQRYVNAVSMVTEDILAGNSDRDWEHPSRIFGRVDHNQHTNNYLEPAPVIGPVRTAVPESFSSSPLSLDLDSPNSVPSLSFTNDANHFQTQPSTPGAYVNTNTLLGSNVYLDHPLRAQDEHSINTMNAIYGYGASAASDSASAFSTLTRKTIVKRSSLDVPPEEYAPILSPVEALHAYANVEGLGSATYRDRDGIDREKFFDSTERCYENLSRLDLPLLLQPPPASYKRDQHAMRENLSLTPSMAVNYIVLDLDQPRSPAQSSPKTCFGSGLSLTVGGACPTTVGGGVTSPAVANGGSSGSAGGSNDDSVSASISAADVKCLPVISVADSGAISNSATPETATVPTTVSTAISTLETTMKTSELSSLQTETSMGYSTIDFIRTCALIKSSTHGADFDPDHDNEESRITRHSKCVRKAYSISE